MQENSCPNCGKTLPGFARYCAWCGEDLSLEDVTISLNVKYPTHPGSFFPFKRASAESAPFIENLSAHQASPESTQIQENYAVSQVASTSLSSASALSLPPEKDDNEWLLTSIEGSVTLKLFRADIPWAGLVDEDLFSSSDINVEDLDDEVLEQRATWQKVVEKTPRALPTVQILPLPKRSNYRYRGLIGPFAPHLAFWLGLLAALALLLGGGFGVALSFGKAAPLPAPSNALTLQISPSKIAMGGIVTLRGTHFTPNGQVSLKRDGQVPLVDTGGVSTIKADAHGVLSDTVIVDPAWLPGTHLFTVTDLHTNQQSLFKVTVTGQNVLQGPPHLLFSSKFLSLGTGDKTMSGSQLLALSNAGSGHVVWQASATQPWLQISPQSGSIASGSHVSVMIVGDRSQLAPGHYSAQIIFVSNTEQLTLAVTMNVTPLQESHEPILQISMAALNFTAIADGPNPVDEALTISDPGTESLAWQATATTQNNGQWLAVSPNSGTVDPHGQQSVTVGANVEGLAPGIYRGILLFSNADNQPVQGSPQRVYVSLTVIPFCALTLTQSNLKFTDTVGHSAPSEQALHIGLIAGCNQTLHWNAQIRTIGGGQWLKLSKVAGSLPTTLQVSVNPGTLGPGTYSGALIFTSSAGQQIVQVTMVINPIPCAISASSSVSLQGTEGQTDLVAQNATLTTNGSCPHALSWTARATVTTPSGGTWLSVATSGTLAASASHLDIPVSATLTGLGANTYTASLTITVTDSSIGQLINTVQIPIQLTVLAQCQLQAPSSPQLAFASNVGSDPATTTLSFTVGVSGNCSGSVTVTPSFDATTASWLTLSGPITLNSGTLATFTINIASTTLTAGSYTSTITLSAVDGNGAIAGSAQTVGVSLIVS